MENKVNLTAIIVVLLVVIGFLAGLYMVNLFNQSTDKTITATGSYQSSVMPDSASISVQIQTKNESAQVAKDENDKISKEVLAELVKIGISREDIETENYNTYPEYDWGDGKQTLIGYVVSNSLKVNTKDFDKVGKIVDASVDAGALVSYINFELSSDLSNQYKISALSNASKDASAKASAIAVGLGGKVGNLVSVSTSDYNYQPYPVYRTMGVAAEDSANLKEVSANVVPNKLDVSATVTAVYALN
jgi:uncharacterized protein YggE